jgi:hypothetical protein
MMIQSHSRRPGRKLRLAAGLLALGCFVAAGSAEAHPRHRGHKHWKHRHRERVVVVREAPCAVAPVVYAPVEYRRVWRPGYWQAYAGSGCQVWVPGAMIVVNF